MTRDRAKQATLLTIGLGALFGLIGDGGGWLWLTVRVANACAFVCALAVWLAFSARDRRRRQQPDRRTG